MNNKICAFTIFDYENKAYADIMTKMWRHFHPDIEMREFGPDAINAAKVGALFYRATPYFTQKLFQEGYETVIKVDADSFIFGNITECLVGDYDIGVVYNWNRTDPKTYGLVSVCDLTPQEYFNCGFVVMKNQEFVKRWLELCYSFHFDRFQYKEQDLLNILCYFDKYVVKRLDDEDNWYGLISKGENAKFILKDNQVICPKSQDKYPPIDKCVKVYHVAGGRQENKMNYKILFNDDIQKFIEGILHEKS
jgi:hypothetical protein